MKGCLVAIPVYNEVRYVERIVAEVRRYAENVLLVDDGSNDGTSEVIDGCAGVAVVRHGRNMGYGKSLADVFGYARDSGFEWVVTMDCDFQHEPAVLEEFYREIARDDADVISGSRYLGLTAEKLADVPVERMQINKRITKLLNAKLGVKLTDAFCGFKAYRVAAIGRIEIDEFGYGMPLQFWVRGLRGGLRVREIGVAMIYHDRERSFGGVLEIAEIRLRYYMEILEREINGYEMQKL